MVDVLERRYAGGASRHDEENIERANRANSLRRRDSQPPTSTIMSPSRSVTRGMSFLVLQITWCLGVSGGKVEQAVADIRTDAPGSAWHCRVAESFASRI